MRMGRIEYDKLRIIMILNGRRRLALDDRLNLHFLMEEYSSNCSAWVDKEKWLSSALIFSSL